MPGRLGFLNFPFLSTLSLRRATLSGSSRATVLVFLSTLSLRRATQSGALPQPPPHISIHALLAESDKGPAKTAKANRNFYPRSPCGERLGPVSFFNTFPKFLSTLSLRRATQFEPPIKTHRQDFYPRSPCGERRAQEASNRTARQISIHALLAESDNEIPYQRKIDQHFYPRSPCGERPLAPEQNTTKQRNFYPRSPCGERRHLSKFNTSQRVFLSTLSLRRATSSKTHDRHKTTISIHALLAESDSFTDLRH